MNAERLASRHSLSGFQQSSFLYPTSPTTFRGAQALESYLRGANLEVANFDSNSNLRAAVVQLPDMTIGRVAISPTRAYWPRDAMSLDRVVLVIAPPGRFGIETEGEVWESEPGLYLVPPSSEQPVTFCVHEQIDELFYIGASRAVIRDIDWLAARTAGTADRVDAGTLDTLKSFIRALCETPVGESGQAAVQTVATEVVRALVRLMVGEGESDRSLFERGKAIIERSHTNPAIVVGDIATALGVSERSVHAAFAEQGTTVMRELRAQRTRAAVAIRLRAPQMSRKDLARAAGFGSISSMVRALRSTEQ